MVYFDNAATTKMDDEVIAIFSKLENQYYYHPDNNKEMKLLKNQLSDKLKLLLKINSKDIITCGSGTIANYIAIVGYANKFESKKHFITTKYEHASVLSAFKYLESIGHLVSYLNVSKDGKVIKEDIIIKDDTVLVSIMGLNNEVGSRNNIFELASYVKSFNKKICFHTDLIQYFAKSKFTDDENIDMYTLSPHKLYGPKNIGLLFKSSKIEINTPFLDLGTESLSLYAMSVKAIMSHVKHFDETDKHINTVVNYLIKELEVIENVEFNVKNKSSIININVDINLMSESMITYFYDNNVALSSKSACSSRTNNPSVTLKSLEINKEKISKSLRISLAKYNTCEEVDYFISVLKEMIKEYK